MKNNLIEMWEVWIKEPPAMAISFDKGKTFEYKRQPIFPFYTTEKDVSWICYKRKVCKEQKINILKSLED